MSPSLTFHFCSFYLLCVYFESGERWLLTNDESENNISKARTVREEHDASSI